MKSKFNAESSITSIKYFAFLPIGIQRPAVKGSGMYKSKKVMLVEFSSDQNLLFFRAHVQASYEKQLRLVFVALEKKGQIFVTKCNCPAQADGKCAHIACLCYFIEDLKRNPEGPIIYEVGTSETQKWGTGKAIGKDPKALEETDYGRKLKMDKYFVDPRPEQFRNVSDKAVEHFVTSLKTKQNKKLDHPNGPMWIHTLNENTNTPEHIDSPAEISTHLYLPYWIFEKVFDKQCPRDQLLRYKAYNLTNEELEFYKANVIGKLKLI